MQCRVKFTAVQPHTRHYRLPSLKSILIVIDRPHEPFPEKYRICSNQTIDVNSRKLRISKPYHTRYQLIVYVIVYAVISYF